MTPTRSIESVDGTPLRGANAWSPRRMSSSSEGGYSPVRHKLDLPRLGRDRLSGSTIVDAEADGDGDIEDHDDELKLKAVVSADGFSDAEKAKVERKIADLEISNSSLLAINRSLEGTKAKQRSEITKLRRMLRETRIAPPLAATPLASPPQAHHRSSDDEGATSGGGEDDEFEEAMDDPALERRWDRLVSLVSAMRKRGEECVAMGKEETRPGVQRVLGWLEVEAMDRENAGSFGGSQLVSAATSEVDATDAAGTEITDATEVTEGY
ncbi:hypothetical protein Q8F55_003366 [Vanrija albida]|uniref:REM-1 domain-containing protein n=1 Tax=Vanrija albida TaxID=181172 RepID=A0ABR3Q4U0_9TREE